MPLVFLPVSSMRATKIHIRYTKGFEGLEELEEARPAATWEWSDGATACVRDVMQGEVRAINQSGQDWRFWQRKGGQAASCCGKSRP